MLWGLVMISVVGTFLNAKKRRDGFLFWIVANAGWICVNLDNTMYEQAALFLLYLILAVYGYLTWDPWVDVGESVLYVIYSPTSQQPAMVRVFGATSPGIVRSGR